MLLNDDTTAWLDIGIVIDQQSVSGLIYSAIKATCWPSQGPSKVYCSKASQTIAQMAER